MAIISTLKNTCETQVKAPKAKGLKKSTVRGLLDYSKALSVKQTKNLGPQHMVLN